MLRCATCVRFNNRQWTAARYRRRQRCICLCDNRASTNSLTRTGLRQPFVVGVWGIGCRFRRPAAFAASLNRWRRFLLGVRHSAAHPARARKRAKQECHNGHDTYKATHKQPSLQMVDNSMRSYCSGVKSNPGRTILRPTAESFHSSR